MTRRLFAVLSAMTLFAAMAVGPAVAHPVGNAGDPDCFGKRISHGAADYHAHGGHGLTPGERAAALEEVLAFFHPISPPEFQEWLEDFFGADLKVSVADMTRWVQANCAGEVPFPE